MEQKQRMAVALAVVAALFLATGIYKLMFVS